MAEITTTQAFSDGDTVTATKLNNITGNASLQTEAITNRSAETTVDQTNDFLLMYDASSTSLKKVTPSNVIKAGTASNFPVTGNATIGGTLGVTGVSTLSGNTSVGGTLGVSDTISSTKTSGIGIAVTSNATIGGTLGVTGASTLSGNTSIGGTLGVTGASTLSGNTSIGGTLSVSGAITASSTVNGTTIPSTKTLVTTDDSQTLSNKTITSPVISQISNTGTLTLPTSTDTLVGRATTDTLTNKTLTSPTINTGAISGGTINNATIGATTPSSGAFTSLSASGNASVSGTLGVTGVLSANGGISGSLTGNASTATTLQTSRTINGISFNGSSNIITNPSSGAYSNGFGARTITTSTSTPTGGSDGDIVYVV